MWTAPPITLTDEERAELFRRVAAHTTAVRAARRARIVLMAADGMPSRQISQRVGMHESNVAKWRNRFRDKGLKGLEDRPRPGGPKRFGHDERMKVAAAATSERDPDDPVSTWTYFDLAQKLWAEGVEIYVSQLWRILTDMDIRLNRVRGWLNRRDDPTFWERVRDVCGLYLNPPERALVLSVDEKPPFKPRNASTPTRSSLLAGPGAASSSTSATAPPAWSPPWPCTPGRSSPPPSNGTTPRTSVPSWKRSKPTSIGS